MFFKNILFRAFTKISCTASELSINNSEFSREDYESVLDDSEFFSISGRIYSDDSIDDLNSIKDIFVKALNKIFLKNNGYSSDYELYIASRNNLDVLITYNPELDTASALFELCKHVFKKDSECSEYYFKNKIVWRSKPNYPANSFGILVEYMKKHNSLITRQEAEDFFKNIGVNSYQAKFTTVIGRHGAGKIFQCAEYNYVLADYLNISETFLSELRYKLDNLFAGSKSVPTGMIEPLFYKQLPTIPSNVSWTIYLLRSILEKYDIGYVTIKASENDDSTIAPAAIVLSGSNLMNFADVVYEEFSNNYSLPITLSTNQFREKLIEFGFIRGKEKVGSAHLLIKGDYRFYLSENNGTVRVIGAI